MEELEEVPPEAGAFPNLTEEELSGESLSPRKKKRSRVLADSEEKPASAAQRAKPKTRRAELAESGSTGWREHLHWVLVLALLPLVLSMLFEEQGSVLDRIERSLEQHPEIDEALVMESASLNEAALHFPGHRLEGALLPADTYWHWGIAGASAVLFLGLFRMMWPRKQSMTSSLVTTGIVTGTVGIMLLLAFQWIAFSTEGMVFRGRGIGVLFLYLGKFIGFSYRCALDDANGFVVSFFGFTMGVGLCEELCKALPVAFYLGYEKRTVREVCLVGLASGAGFGISEGITYSAEYYNGIYGIEVYLIRFLSCVSLHAIWAGCVALLIDRNQDYLEWSWEGAAGFVFHYLLVAMILHGLYDTLLKQEHELLAVYTALASFLWFQWLLLRAEGSRAERDSSNGLE